MSAIDDMSDEDWKAIFGGGGDGLTDPAVDPSITDPGDPYTGAGDPGSQQNPDDPFAGYNVGGSGGSGGFSLGSLAKLLGLTGKDGSLSAGSLLPLLASLGIGAGGYMANKSTKEATDQVVNSLKDANTQVTGILGNASKGYDPYTQMGASATQALPGAVYKPIAGNFRPLGQGATLGTLMRGR